MSARMPMHILRSATPFGRTVFSVWPGRSAATLRFPAPWRTYPHIQVRAFAGMRLTLPRCGPAGPSIVRRSVGSTRSGISSKKASDLTLPDFVCCHILWHNNSRHPRLAPVTPAQSRCHARCCPRR
jgi:hypothetical protein